MDREAWEKIDSIDGWLTHDEATALYELAMAADGPIIEIGSWRGRSTAALALGSMFGRGQPVFAVDSFIGVPPVDRLTAKGENPAWNSSSPQQLRANLDAVGVNGLLKIVPKDSSEAAGDVPECALLFVDGGHHYDVVCRDLELYLPKVKERGHVVVHDCIEGEPDVVRAVEKYLMACPNEWRAVRRAGSTLVFQRRKSARHKVRMAFPGRNLIFGAAKGLMTASLGAHDVDLDQSGNGWDDMNILWLRALNDASRGKITHFAMLHSDVVPSIGWLDVLLNEQEDLGCDLLSVAIALKDERAIMSCGVGEFANPWQAFRRFTMHELLDMPETFSLADTPHNDQDKYLLHNTGCWVADLRSRLWRKTDDQGYLKATFSFPVAGRLKADGTFEHLRESEDWYFSRKIAELGANSYVTRKVEAWHIGETAFGNRGRWGKWKEDLDTKHKWDAANATLVN
jgi:hypothetical protein